MGQSHGMTKTVKRGYTVMLEDGELVEEQLRARNSGIPLEEHGEIYRCSCGEVFQDKQDVVNHLTKVNDTKSSEKSVQTEEIEVNTAHSGEDSVPETVDEWKMWSPCPECQSTTLIRAIYTNNKFPEGEDGPSGGDTTEIDAYEHIKCKNCDLILFDKSS